MKSALFSLLFAFSLVFISGCGDERMAITGKLQEITLKNSEGKEVTLEYSDELTLLVFWATWCQPCIMEIPSLVEVNRKYREQGLRVTSILTDSPGLGTIRDIEKAFKMNYEILLGSELVAAQFGINAFPTSFLVTKGGKVVDKMMGLTPHDLLESKIEFHLGN